MGCSGDFQRMNSRNQSLTLALTWCTYCLSYFLRKPVSYLKIILESEFHLSKQDLGWIDISLLLPYALVQIFCSTRLDGFNPAKVASVCLFLATVSFSLCGLTYSLIALCFCLAISGGSQALLWPSCTKMISHWYPTDSLGTTIGLLSTAPYIGSFVSITFVTYFTDNYNWRYVFIPIAAAGVVHSLIIWSCWTPRSSIEQALVKGSNGSISQICSIDGVYQTTVAAFCLKFVRYFMLMWIPLFLSNELGYTSLKIGLFSTIFEIGGIFGGPLLGYLTDNSSHHPMKVVLMASIVGAFAVALFMVSIAWGEFGIIFPLFVAGVCNCGSDTLLTGSITMMLGNSHPLKLGAGVTSLVNGVSSFGGIVEGPIVAFIFTFSSWGSVLAINVLMSFLGAFMVYRANAVINKNKTKEKELASNV